MVEPPPGMFGAKPAPKEEKKGGLFVIKSSKPKAAPIPSVTPAEVAALSGRLRVIEERIYNLRRKSQVTDQNMLMHNKKIAGNIRDLDSDIKELRMDIEDIRSVMQQIISEMKKFASRNDVDIIKKYVDLWEPLNFVTRNEVDKIVREKITEIHGK
ncbi:MAG: hypothetical protein KAS15_01005 [Nanoarchaeota archaeon]|nr:hypothetical protein [Nanoarchaeota archaeon]MCK5630604.1 hypothetical protein [Nanoarchaeota archaeon]